MSLAKQGGSKRLDVTAIQQRDAMLLEPFSDVWRQGLRLSENVKKSLDPVIACNPIEIDRVAGAANMDQHDIAGSGAPIFVKAIMLECQPHRFHAGVAG